MSNTAEIVRKPSVETYVHIDDKDLVNVAVATYEQNLLELQKSTRKELSSAEDAKQKANTAYSKSLKTCADKKLKTKLAKLNTAAKELQIKGVQISTVNVASEKGKLCVNLSSNDKRVYRPSLALTGGPIIIPVDANVKKAKKAQEDADKKVEDLKTALVDIRKKLSELATVERRARANLTVAELSKTDEGKALLESIDITSFKKLAYEE